MDIDKVSYTGSTSVGQLVQQAAGRSNAKRVTLELGGKSPIVVMNDADVELAAKIAHDGVFDNQGQCCCAASRAFVQEEIYDKFVTKSIQLAKERIVGDPFDESVHQGPQIDGDQMSKILSLIDCGKSEGANLETGGARHGTAGFFVEPTVFSNVNDEMTIAKEEIFGPVQQILRFKTLDEVIERCNKGPFGLAAGIVTKNINDAIVFSNSVQAGTVWVNSFLPISPQIPFGGFKMSGYGREGGEDGLHGYCEVKQVTIAIPEKNS